MALSKLAVRRLTKLADFMAAMPKAQWKHFDMGCWFDHAGDDSEHGLKRGQKITPKELSYCGTTACALGWATQIPAFRRAGLVLKHGGDMGSVSYKRAKGNSFRAAEAFFGIDEYQSQDLFTYDADDETPKGWATRCRKFIRANAGE